MILEVAVEDEPGSNSYHVWLSGKSIATDVKMKLFGRPPKTTSTIIPEKPPKGHFFFAGHTYKRLPWWSVLLFDCCPLMFCQLKISRKRKNMRTLYFFIVLL